MSREFSATETRHGPLCVKSPGIDNSVWPVIGYMLLWANTVAIAILSVAVFIFVAIAEHPHPPRDAWDIPEPILNSLFRFYAFLTLLLSGALQFTALFLGARRKSDIQASFAAVSLLLILADFVALRLHGGVQ